MPSTNQASEIEDLFERVLAQPFSRRAALLDQECAGDPARRQRLERLLRFAESDDGFLERSPFCVPSDERDSGTLYAPGRSIGAYRLLRRLGAGGTAEVWLAERTEGGFQQRAAVKIIRDAQGSMRGRFAIEREILASLTHPNIARLYDGGVEPDGCAYMIMEYVEGQHLGAYAAAQSLSLDDRLALFLQICDAVAYAHTRLVVHRDIKPSNILVTSEGRVKLLDFGIAKLLGAESAQDATRTLHLSPAYAAPEQLTGGYISTVTDVYALGVTLFELLTGRLPWSGDTTSLATALKRLLDDETPSASRTTGRASPVSTKSLQGDLDAIVARCLRKEPGHRYATVDALKLDVQRHLRGEPVAARDGARVYVLSRLLRRYRWGAAGVALLILALAAGLGSFAWQARRVEAQAARAEAIKNFLLDVFKASDPRKAVDKPRGGTTARELLDASSVSIEKDFGDQPDLQIELLGVTADIFRELDEPQRYAELHDRYMALARARYGELHPLVIDAYLQEAFYDAGRDRYDSTRLILDKVDLSIRDAGLDEQPQRARWWIIKVASMTATAANQAEREALLTRALDVFDRAGQRDRIYVHGLLYLGNIYGTERKDFVRSRDVELRAKAAIARLPQRDDSQAASAEFNLAMASESLGDLEEAAAGYERAANLNLRTYGERLPTYWMTLGHWAKAVCDNGGVDRAQQLFEKMLSVIPKKLDPNESYLAARSRQAYAVCLLREGRPMQAIPLLEAAEQQYRSLQEWPTDLLGARGSLGEAYAGAGRNDEAQDMLKTSLDGYLAQAAVAGTPDNAGLLNARERWGRFMLKQGRLGEAEGQFREILAQDRGRNLAVAALAHAGVASVALRRGDAKAALDASTQALRVFDNISGYRNVRMEPYVWRIHAQALVGTGDFSSAQDYAQRALRAFTRFNDRASAEVAESAAVVAEIGRLEKK